jgi:hypothetical protein
VSSNFLAPWKIGGECGLEFWVNGTRRRLLSIGVDGTAPGTLPVWTAAVDGCLGCGGTLDAALVLAARAAEMTKDPATEKEPGERRHS